MFHGRQEDAGGIPPWKFPSPKAAGMEAFVHLPLKVEKAPLVTREKVPKVASTEVAQAKPNEIRDAV